MALKINHAGVGYIPNKGEFGKHSRYYTGPKKPDVSEAFLLQRDWGSCPPNSRNQWPDGETEFQATMIAFFEATEDLSLQMLPLYARALDMPPDFFQDKFPKDRCLNVLRVSHMPPDPLEDNEFNICPHTDGSFMTLLATSDQPGPRNPDPISALDHSAADSRCVRGQLRRPARPLVQRAGVIHSTSGGKHLRYPSLLDSLFLTTNRRNSH